MRQYELAIRIAQVHHLVDERKYKKALAVIQTLDMRQVRSLSDLKVFAEVYTKMEQYEAAKATYLRVYRRSRTRRVLYRLIYLSIRTNALDDAESYYQEFIRMNPNKRDTLILRYRIDKASGVPIGKLIEILQELKQEEYIEEWAYELAKLYHRAGRRKECLEECEDILLWFGTGEIVERAKILIDHLHEQDSMPYYDDKDFTVPKKEEPNPDDTGSLPDLNEFIRERKAQKKEERRVERTVQREEVYDEEQEEDLVAFDKKEAFVEKDTLDEELAAKTAQQLKEKEEAAKVNSVNASDNTFIDDYEEDDFEIDAIDFSQKAKDGIQKLSGLLKIGKKEEEKLNEPSIPEKKPEVKKELENKKIGYVPHSQSGTGITQDLAREISAIYEMEHREQLKEKAVTVINEAPNLATNVVDRMTQAIQKSAGRGYIPIDVEEIHVKSAEGSVGAEYMTKTREIVAEEEPVAEAIETETEVPKDALMAALDAEVEQYYEKLKQTTAVENEVEDTQLENSVAEENENIEEDVTMVIEESDEDGVEETVVKEVPESQASEVELLKELLEEEIQDPEDEASLEARELAEDISYEEESVEENMEDMSLTEQEVEQEAEAVAEEEPEAEQEVEAVAEEEPEAEQEVEAVAEEEPEAEQEVEAAVAEEEPEAEQEVEVAVAEEPEAEQEVEVAVAAEEEPEAEQEVEAAVAEEEPEAEQEVEAAEAEEELEVEQEVEVAVAEEEPEAEQEVEAAVAEEEPEVEQKVENVSPKEESASAALKNYHAPKIPVVETEYMEMPEITYEDLPTTRALQQSFQNVLKLIAGELDPSHFVLMGDGTDRIVGVSKQIVRVMKETGYLSQGRIAKIHASQLNKMDLITFRSQLKGNCLLIENAADLLFPTITKIFSIMEEYYGNFVVILADEGTTLDQLFRFVPVLAKKFKYIIDISKYTENDYK